MRRSLENSLRETSKLTGVYLFRDEKGRVIYVGKAVNLKTRVSSYFNQTEKDQKTIEMTAHIKKLDTIICGSEFEALVLESELIKRYKPKYNVRLKDDKSYVYIKISSESYPRVTVTREIIDTSAKYLGPFIDAGAVRSILKIARKIFPYCTCRSSVGEVCLYYHLGLCRGHDEGYVSSKEYKKEISGLVKLFSGKTGELERSFLKKMKIAAKEKNYEVAASYRDRLRFLEKIKKSHFISERDLSADRALIQLKNNLNLAKIPKRIECFDVSNIMGTAAVGSMAVFKDGVASPKDYRRFKIRTVKGANDYAMMAEVLARRFCLIVTSKAQQPLKLKPDLKNSGSRPNQNLKLKYQNSELPDLVILDGGKGQLSAVLQNLVVPEGVKIIALAKKQETVYEIRNSKFEIQNLAKGSEALYLIQRVRDEAHRFAVSYHRKVRSKDFFDSSIDAIPGVGPKTKKKLIKEFGSIEKIRQASVEDLSRIVSKNLAEKIKESI